MSRTTDEMYEYLKSAAESVGKAAVAAVGAVSKTAGEVYDSAKRGVRVLELKNRADANLKKIGEMAYAAHTGADFCEEDMEEVFEELDGIYAEIAEIKSKK